MSRPQPGDRVRVHLRVQLDDGSVVESTRESEPVLVTLGRDELLPTLEKTIRRLSPGQSKHFTVSPEDAFGAYNPERVTELARQALPSATDLAVGARVIARGPEGQDLAVMVLELGEETVRVDGNHPLAGKHLHYEVELVEIL